MSEVYEDGTARILRLMKDTFGGQFSYFNGELLNLDESYLPCIMVTTPTASINSSATGTDEIEESITIIIALNIKDDIGATPDTNLTDLKLRKYVMGQDPTTGQYLAETVMYAIRKHITMNSDTLQSDINIDFHPNDRGTDRSLPTQEADITVNIKRRVLVPSRD